MRAPLALSIFLHLAVFVISWIGVPYVQPPVIEPESILDVEVITEEAQAPEPKSEPELKVAAVPASKPPPPPPPPPPPEPEVVDIPPPPDEKAEPIPQPKPEPKLKEKVEEKPKVKSPPRPRLKPKPPVPDEFESVLKSVAKLEKKKKENIQKPKEKTFEQKIIDALRKRESAPQKLAKTQFSRLGQAVTQSDKDAVRRQIERCWNPPVGAPKAEDLIVDLRLEVNPDGTVRTVDVADSSRMNSDPYYRAAAESAVRAVLNPRCRKLKLPPEKYDEWKILIIGFDPREMLGR
jgi:outer membrane biosynthesis protein TonB